MDREYRTLRIWIGGQWHQYGVAVHQVRVSDLPDLTGTNIFPQPMLVCECGEYSANSCDYFMAKKDVVLHCDECGVDMVLMTKRVVYEEWSPKKA